MAKRKALEATYKVHSYKETRYRVFNLLGGLVMPVWDTVERIVHTAVSGAPDGLVGAPVCPLGHRLDVRTSICACGVIRSDSVCRFRHADVVMDRAARVAVEHCSPASPL